jgi:membrane protease YdiL (CAAX protease family)
MKPIEDPPVPEVTKPTTGRLPKVPWKPWWALVFAVVVYYGSQFAAGAAVTIYPWLKHWSGAQATDWLNNSVGAQFVFILLAEIFTVGAVYYFLKRYKLGLPAIGLKRPRWRDLAYGLSAVLPYYLLYLLTVGMVSHFVTGLNVNQQQNIGFTNVHGSAQLVLTFISLVVLPPIAEEIMVRGFLYSSLKKGLPLVWAVIGTSAIFAIAHLPEGGATGPLYIAALDTFILSLVLIYLREKTGSLWASITLHAFKNGVAFVALFAFHLR